MRNSLALLGIPDLPIHAFRHVGDKKIRPEGGVSSVVESVSDTVSNAVSSVSDALATVDDTVNSAVPGGWATVVSIAVPVAAPYIQAAQAGNVIAKGGSLEDAAKGYVISSIASEAGGAVGAETGSNIAGNVAGGTTAGLLSGKSLEQSLKNGVVSGGISQVTPSTLLSSTPSGTTGTQEYIPETNIGQGTPSSTSSFYPSTIDVTPKNLVVEPIITQTPTTPTTPSGNLINETGQITDFAKNKETNELYKPLGTNEYGGNYVPVLGTQGQAQGLLTGQGTTGATNMADYYTNDYENYDSQNMYTNPYSAVGADNAYLANTQTYNNPYDALSADNAYMATQALTPEQLSQVGMGAPTDYLSSLDAATQALIKKALAAGGSAARGAMNFLSQKGVVQGGLGTAANLMQLQADRQAAQQAQARIGQATQQAVAGSQFRPVGVTTRFGSSNFQIDPTTGQLVSAGYTASPEITSAQNKLLGLGASYLAQTPQDVAQKYMQDQLALLAPSREQQSAQLINQLQNTGRTGLSVAQGGGLLAANPEMAALANARTLQDLQLAANATQAGQQNVLFGTGLFGQAGNLENMAQQPFNLSQGLAEKSSVGGYRSGSLGLQGNVYGNAIGLSGAMTTNPYATVLGGLSSPTSTLGTGLANWLTSSAPTTGGITSQGMMSPTVDAYGNYVPLGYANY
jgi:hypothetical protein